MELLQTALVITLLTIASAKPMRWRDHQDADIADKDWIRGLQDRSNWRLYQRREYSSDEDDSSESSETESSESSEEIIVEQTTPAETTLAETTPAETTLAETTPAKTTPAKTTPAKTTVDVTTAITEEGSTLAPEPDTMPTSGPTAMETTQQPGSPSTPVDVTSPCVSGQCVIFEILTQSPVTDNRGDN